MMVSGKLVERLTVFTMHIDLNGRVSPNTVLLAQLTVCFAVYLRHPHIFGERLVWKLLGGLLPHGVQKLAPVTPATRTLTDCNKSRT